jgi:hypothetical protein
LPCIENKKPTFGMSSEVGSQRFDLSFPYRAIPPHHGALLQQQQMQAPTLLLWLIGYPVSYIGGRESQFVRNRMAQDDRP